MCKQQFTVDQRRREGGGRGRAAAPGDTLQRRHLRDENLDSDIVIDVGLIVRMGVADWRGGTTDRAAKTLALPLLLT